MKIKKTVSLVLLVCIIFTLPVYARSPVWKISKNGNHLFIGGTIHILRDTDYPLPGAFETAYSKAMLLVLETDLQQFNTPKFQQALLQKTMYTNGRNITQFLAPDTLAALQDYLTGNNIPLEAVIKFKPGLLSLTLTVGELQRLGLTGIGVDQFFNSRALNEQKEIRHLETIYEQLTFISKLGEGNENAFIQYTLDDLKNLGQLFDAMKKAWEKGDIVKLKKVALDPWKDLFPKIYTSLLVDRNNNWLPQIEAMLTTQEVEFVLFGFLHLVGEDGILTQLEALGCKIENLP